jgi:hypothetical protein
MQLKYDYMKALPLQIYLCRAMGDHLNGRAAELLEENFLSMRFLKFI